MTTTTMLPLLLIRLWLTKKNNEPAGPRRAAQYVLTKRGCTKWLPEYRGRQKPEPKCAGLSTQSCGAVAQLGERLAGSEEVRGSSPLGSTIFICALPPANPTRWFRFGQMSITSTNAQK